MKKLILAVAICSIFVICGTANALTIADEDFETVAEGWSDNSTTTGNAVFSTFLGRHGGTGGAQGLNKTFALSGNQTEVTLNFEFYQIDSWDVGETFNVYINDGLVESHVYRFSSHQVYDGVTNTFGSPALENYGFWTYSDQGMGYSFTYATSDTSIKLGFGSTLDQNIEDESWGIDNVYITDNVNDNPPPVPEPATMLLLATGLVGLFGYNRKHKSKK